jgi:hypothetical protein
MWEQLTPADIERARHRLALMRAETLIRHAEELKSLDTDRTQIETFEQIAAAFAQKYMNSATSTSQQTTASEEQSTAAVEASERPVPEIRQDAFSAIQVVHQPTPHFGVPLRRSAR